MSTNRWLATGNYFTSYKDEQRLFFTHLDRTIFAVFLTALFVWPLLFDLSNKYMLVIDNVLIAVVAVMGLNIVTGFAGLISIGHAAFVGIGAYTIASFVRVLGDSHVLLTHAWPLMIILAGIVGAVFGAIAGLPAMRLKHLYLAIATLSFQMIFTWTINFMEFFNQGQTIAVSRVFWFTGKLARDQHYFFWYYVIMVVIVIMGFGVRNLLRTRYGRCLSAVRDNDRAADAMGMHPGLTKVYAFALAGFFCRRGRCPACLRLPGRRHRILFSPCLHQLPGHGHRGRSRDIKWFLLGTGGHHYAGTPGGDPGRTGRSPAAFRNEPCHGLKAPFFWPGNRPFFNV